MKTMLFLALLGLFASCKFDINGDLEGAKATTGTPDQTQGARVYAIDNGGNPYVFTFNDDGSYTLRQYALSMGMWLEVGGTYTDLGQTAVIDSYTFLQVSDSGMVGMGICGMSLPVPITNVVFNNDFSEVEYDQDNNHFILTNVETTPITLPDISGMPNLCP